SFRSDGSECEADLNPKRIGVARRAAIAVAAFGRWIRAGDINSGAWFALLAVSFDFGLFPRRRLMEPIVGPERPVRRRLGLRGELLLALLPTAMILAVLLLVETLSRQRLLF